MCRECGLYISAMVDVQPVWSVDLGDSTDTPVAFHGNCWPRVRRMWAKRYNKNVNRVIYRVHPKIWERQFRLVRMKMKAAVMYTFRETTMVMPMPLLGPFRLHLPND